MHHGELRLRVGAHHAAWVLGRQRQRDLRKTAATRCCDPQVAPFVGQRSPTDLRPRDRGGGVGIICRIGQREWKGLARADRIEREPRIGGTVNSERHRCLCLASVDIADGDFDPIIAGAEPPDVGVFPCHMGHGVAGIAQQEPIPGEALALGVDFESQWRIGTNVGSREIHSRRGHHLDGFCPLEMAQTDSRWQRGARGLEVDLVDAHHRVQVHQER